MNRNVSRSFDARTKGLQIPFFPFFVLHFFLLVYRCGLRLICVAHVKPNRWWCNLINEAGLSVVLVALQSAARAAAEITFNTQRA